MRKYKLANTTYKEKYGALENSVGELLGRVQGDRDLVGRIRGVMGDIAQMWNRDVEMYRYEEEPVRVVGERGAVEVQEVRNLLESQVREAWATAELWKQKFLGKGQESTVVTKTTPVYDDRELTSLRNQVATLSQQVRTLESEKQRIQLESTSKFSSSTLLESQLREAKAEVDRTKLSYESQLNDLRRQITDYTKKLSDSEKKVAELQTKLTEAQATTVINSKPTTASSYGTTFTTTGLASSPGGLGSSYGSAGGLTQQSGSSVLGTGNYSSGNSYNLGGSYNSSITGGVSSASGISGTSAVSSSGYNATKFTENLYTPSASRTLGSSFDGKFGSTGSASLSKAPLASSMAFGNISNTSTSCNSFVNPARVLTSSIDS